MRQPIRFDPPRPEPDRYTRLPVAIPHREVTERPARRITRHGSGLTDSTAVRGILALIAIVLIAVLAYLLTLSSRPTFSNLAPAPNSETAPGIVTVQVNVNAAHPIQEIQLLVDGGQVSPAVSPSSDRHWMVRYQAVLPKGSHKAQISVVDTQGKIQEHGWTFTSAGARVAPSATFMGPPTGASFAQGLLRIAATATSEDTIQSATMTINGEPFPVTINPVSVRPDVTVGSNARQEWEIGGERSFSVGSFNVQLSVVDLHGDATQTEWQFQVVQDPAKANARYFSTNRVYVYGPFKSFWEAHDGVRLFGNPVSTQYVNENGLSVQYFERGRFELQKDNSVQLGRLGTEAFHGSSEQVDKPSNFAGRYFPETGHTLTSKFQEFWEQNGGLQIFGYPISEVIDEDGTRVQYFERGRLELAGGNGDSTTIQVTPLGTQLWNAKSLRP